MTFDSFSFRAYEFISYKLRAVGSHALHSPFLFDLYNKTILPSKKKRIEKIEKLRKDLRKDHSVIEVVDYKYGETTLSSIASITKSVTSTSKFSSFLGLLIDHLSADSVLETGTSLGLNALYLAENARKLTTIEGSSVIASLARKNFEKLDSKNIRMVNSSIYHALESEIVLNKPDFYFLDADHRSSSVAFCIDLILKHTPDTKCIVVHDIYWSKDMKTMWNSLVQDPRFILSVDMFQAGLLFPNLSMENQHFTLRF